MQQHQEQNQNQNQNHRRNFFPVSLFNTTTTTTTTYNLKLPDPPPPPSTSTSTSTSPVTPPYWLHQHHSNASQASLDATTTHRTSLIRLEDHTEDPTNEASKGLWARSVTIDDYVVVGGKGERGMGIGMGIGMGKGKGMGIGGFGVGAYSEFDDLRSKLASAFPYAKSALPQLPPKSAIFKFSPEFLEARRAGLAYFLNCVLLNPEFSGSAVLKEVLFSHAG
ncbi:hypothetical protein PAAG_11928 [Paracoccidioides lutzii Pb01]|uniref:Endosomal/vacuolar adapter protein YPT35 n=1 Tax=Paracoccidioides lutzii (strain ATCC MYA-826 / Pb01) TaxID=502779 RepID=A0A0A2V0M0_PARBA|nr:hypothetical protein PAAG_11928 [Paracoccidioides lutzii Pb01]KGQ01351.1 hypothetical protein PAAG_11928 [Paracoccidioides lutzii Pb01]